MCWCWHRLAGRVLNARIGAGDIVGRCCDLAVCAESFIRCTIRSFRDRDMQRVPEVRGCVEAVVLSATTLALSSGRRLLGARSTVQIRVDDRRGRPLIAASASTGHGEFATSAGTLSRDRRGISVSRAGT